jgi:NIMA (never in mitosis gene a)-related kinase
LPSESERRSSYPQQRKRTSGKSVSFGPSRFGVDQEDSVSSVKPVHTYLHRHRPVDLSANDTSRVVVRRPAVSSVVSNSSKYVPVRSNQPKSGGLLVSGSSKCSLSY